MMTKYAGSLELKQLKAIPKSKKKALILKISRKYEWLTTEIRDHKHPSGSFQCPYCHKKGTIIGNGYIDKAKKRKRYLCKACTKTFNDHTGTIFHKLKLREYIFPFLEMMLEGLSIREIASNLAVSPATVHRWRHLVLKFIQIHMSAHIEKLLKAYEETTDPNYSFTESSYREINPSRKGLNHQDISSYTTLVQFHYNRLGYFYITSKQLRELKPKQLLIRTVYDNQNKSTSIETEPPAAAIGTKFVYSQADRRLLHHRKHVQHLHENFNERYKQMRGVAQPYLNGYLQWHCFLAESSKLSNTGLLSAVLLACI